MLTKITDDFHTDLELITNFELSEGGPWRYYAEYVCNGSKFTVIGEKAINLKNAMNERNNNKKTEHECTLEKCTECGLKVKRRNVFFLGDEIYCPPCAVKVNLGTDDK